VGFIKVSAKPLKASLATWASKWVYLFTHFLQVRAAAAASWVAHAHATRGPLLAWRRLVLQL
jgi:hypothetical protein